MRESKHLQEIFEWGMQRVEKALLGCLGSQSCLEVS